MNDSFQKRALEKIVDEAAVQRSKELARRAAERKICADRGYVRKNVYLCDVCGAGWVSVDIDEGVTPFMDLCPICRTGMGTSLMYNIPQQILAEKPARIEWRKPTPDEVREASPAARHHNQQGGLFRAVAIDGSQTGRETALAAAVYRLRAIEKWFDTDPEILEAMDPDTRADHERQRRLIRETLGQITSV